MARDLLTVDPGGVSMVVDIFDPFGTSTAAFAAAAGGSAISLPATITTATAFYLARGRTYAVSAKVSGVEVASNGARASVTLVGAPVTITPSVQGVQLVAVIAAAHGNGASSTGVGFYGATPVAAASRASLNPSTATASQIVTALIALGLVIDGS